MQIVQGDDYRGTGGRIAQEGRRRLEQPEATALGVRRRRLREVRDELAELRENGGQLGPLVSELGAHGVRLAFADVGSQGLHPGPVGGCSAGLPAAPDAHAGPALPGVVAELLGQPALADPGLAGHEGETPAPAQGVVERAQEVAQLALAADERAAAGGRRRDRRGRRRGVGRGPAVELGILAQDGLLELAQLAAGLDAELVDERPARVLICGERVGLASGPVEREHELAAQAFAQRVLDDERLELAHHVAAAQLQIGLDPIRERFQAQLVQASDLCLGERREGEVGQRGAAPQRERRPEVVRRGGGGAGAQRRSAFVEVAPEAVEVDGVGLDLQEVPGRAGDEDVGLQDLAQGGDVDLDELDGGSGRPLAPQLVDDPVARHDLVRVEQQQSQQGSLLRRPEPDRRTVHHRLQRAQQPELDHPMETLTERSPPDRDPSRGRLLRSGRGIGTDAMLVG
jgi:hypothetical protein